MRKIITVTVNVFPTLLFDPVLFGNLYPLNLRFVAVIEIIECWVSSIFVAFMYKNDSSEY